MASKPVQYDWLKGGTKAGQKYTAWSTYQQGTPDFGKGSGPGIPYHEVQRVMQKTQTKIPKWTNRPSYSTQKYQRPKMGSGSNENSRVEAIRRRLGWA